MKILVTGASGFIGSFLIRQLLADGNLVVGVDSINDYYDVDLKYYRLSESGIHKDSIKYGDLVQSSFFSNYHFMQLKLEDKLSLDKLFEKFEFDVVCNLAAQAGVRYSIENPYAYIDSNIIGFLNILEACRIYKIKHLVYASSSSVYGKNSNVPFKESDSVAHPSSLYAATKKSNELMAHVYSNLYNLPTTGLRFFTVYGPAGRPDMAPFLFTDAITKGIPIKIFNNGNMLRDFTFIDDIVEGIIRVINKPAISDINWQSNSPNPSTSDVPYRIYNIGNSQPIKLLDFIAAIENALGLKAIKHFMPMQLGDVYQTNADSNLLENDFGFKPSTSLVVGVDKFIAWYKEYYKLD